MCFLLIVVFFSCSYCGWVPWFLVLFSGWCSRSCLFLVLGQTRGSVSCKLFVNLFFFFI
jgi:hypothetical protein